MGSYVEILGIEFGPPGGELLGCFLDVPSVGTKLDERDVFLEGWVLGRNSSVRTVEVSSSGTVLRRTRVNERRKDVASAYPGVAGAETSGFRTSIRTLGLKDVSFDMVAITAEGRRTRIATVEGRRRWQPPVPRFRGLASIVIPCFNQGHFLAEAIESVVQQERARFEIVVVDDGSTDNTPEVAMRYSEVRLIRQQNRGLAGARNAGLRSCAGEFIVFLDADDRLLPGALEHGQLALEGHPDCAMAVGRTRRIGIEGPVDLDSALHDEKADLFIDLLKMNIVDTPAAVMYRRAAFEYLTGFDESMSPTADYDVNLHFSRWWPAWRSNRLVAEYRHHGSSMSRDIAPMLSGTISALRRQRKEQPLTETQVTAWRDGLANWRRHYGPLLADQIFAQGKRRDWRRALRSFGDLLRWSPKSFRDLIKRRPT